jgi:hypothetical protein
MLLNRETHLNQKRLVVSMDAQPFLFGGLLIFNEW